MEGRSAALLDGHLQGRNYIFLDIERTEHDKNYIYVAYYLDDTEDTEFIEPAMRALAEEVKTYEGMLTFHPLRGHDWIIYRDICVNYREEDMPDGLVAIYSVSLTCG